jgi:hypothetical protein
MAETLISPGVLARENDQSFVTSQPVERGAAIIGPTVLGPIERPTLVSSFSAFQAIFLEPQEEQIKLMELLRLY